MLNVLGLIKFTIQYNTMVLNTIHNVNNQTKNLQSRPKLNKTWFNKNLRKYLCSVRKLIGDNENTLSKQSHNFLSAVIKHVKKTL
jgi:hypothetical protein